MASVYTDLGPGEVVETKTVRGRTSYRVAGQDFDFWFDEQKLGFAPVNEDNSVDLPYDPRPQYGVGPLSESTIQPIHEIDAEERTSPADSLTFDNVEESEAGRQPGPNPDLFAKSSAAFGIGIKNPSHHGAEADYEDAYPPGHEFHDPDAQDYHPSDAYGDLSKPYPEDTDYGDDQFGDQFGGSRMLEHHLQNPINMLHGYRQADVLEGEPTRLTPEFIVNDTEDEFLRDVDLEDDERETTDPEGIVHFAGRQVHARHVQGWAAVIPAAEALLPSVARGVGMGAAQDMLGGDDEQGDPQQQGAPSGVDAMGNAIDQVAPDGHPLPIPDIDGGGWGSLTHKKGGLRPDNLDARYADIYTAYDPNDHLAAFRHDPEAYINRVGHAEYEGLDPRMGSYVDLVEADEQLRTAAWKDVRTKAMRLRREGRVDVQDVGPDRIYASVQGDHGTYDVMIKKGGDFGGFGGGHSITNWHCACEWGKWAFQRRFTFVGRLCSHGYASYLEMQSNHMKGQPQTRRTKRASDQTTQDWKIDDTGDAKGALDELRNWAETPQEEDLGNMAERVEDIRDAVDKAREEGVDADQLVASLQRHAAPIDEDQTLPFTPGSTGTGQYTVAPSAAGNDSRAGDAGFGLPAGGFGGPAPSPGAPGAPAGGSLFGPGASGGGAAPQPLIGPGAEQPEAKPQGGSDYTVKPGDTLSGIAESHGGGDYNSITNAGGGEIGNKDLINPGQKLDLSGVSGGSAKGSGSDGGIGSGVDTGAVSKPGAADGTSSNNAWGMNDSATGGGIGNAAVVPAQKPASRRQADIPGQVPGQPPPGVAPGQPGSAPAINPAQAPGAVAAPGAPAPAAGGVPTDAATSPIGDPADVDISGTTSDSGNGMPGASSATAPSSNDALSGGGAGGGGFDMGSIGDTVGTIGDAVSSGIGAVGDVASAIGGIFGSRQLEADRDWFEAAYPDAKFQEHKPFNGSGGDNVTEWGQSKDNVKENYSDNRDDVTKEPNKGYLKDTGPLEELRDGKTAMVGISRAGKGPQRPPVIPEVVRERKPRRPGQVEANVPDYEDFDPLAPRTAASFDNPYAEQEAEQAGIMAASNGHDIVAAFQAQGGGAVYTQAAATSAYDDLSSSPVMQRALQRTAGRNYSLAEQDALIREGDKGGAGNLNSLELKGTHYEAMESVGLW